MVWAVLALPPRHQHWPICVRLGALKGLWPLTGSDPMGAPSSPVGELDPQDHARGSQLRKGAG
eukprot:8462652-Alexandrium_andersonii.AAC.1